ncbi:MAG: cryptochrome/photolyase family protein [Armatimonadota bacterium]
MGNLVLILGDQLQSDSAAFDDFNRDRDAVWMAEVAHEAEHVPSHRARIAIFLSAMRHFRESLRDRGFTVHYHALDDPENAGSFAGELRRTIPDLAPERLIVVEPGEWRVEHSLRSTAGALKVPLEVRTDRHFLASKEDFANWAEGRKQLRHENFYRMMRREFGVLMDDDDPVGGDWNYDEDNRETFGADGPPEIPRPSGYGPDETTREVLDLVRARFPDHPGSLDTFAWPVTKRQATYALKDFVRHRLRDFGTWEDAMWTGEPYVYHSRLSPALNLKLLDPRDCIEAAVTAYEDGNAPINSVEGFVRQILGWREYVRGVYWQHMPEYASLNHFGADLPLPWLYWSGETEMACMRECIEQTLNLGYAHHIQRLMVTGQFATLLGVDPREIHEWYLAIYCDAVEWVEMPNVLGMSQFADGGIMASKPYISTGKYINRMSNYCANCRFDPEERTGDDACPFTTLYWHFLWRHHEQLEEIPRMNLQTRNLDRIEDVEMKRIKRDTEQLRKDLCG